MSEILNLPVSVVHCAEVSNVMNRPTVFSELATLENQTCGTSPWSAVRASDTSDISAEGGHVHSDNVKMPLSHHVITGYVCFTRVIEFTTYL
jgi:hypothetical protein